MEPSNWAPEHSDALREHLARGMSYSEAARAINAKFNTDYSRNAVVGRARRTGLARFERPKDRTPPVPMDQQPSRLLLRKRSAAMSRWIVPVFPREETEQLRWVDVDPRHLSLFDLAPDDCRYPYGGDEEGEAITFCGRPKRDGSSYCTAHFHLTRGPDAPPARAFSAAVLRIVEAA